MDVDVDVDRVTTQGTREQSRDDGEDERMRDERVMAVMRSERMREREHVGCRGGGQNTFQGKRAVSGRNRITQGPDRVRVQGSNRRESAIFTAEWIATSRFFRRLSGVVDSWMQLVAIKHSQLGRTQLPSRTTRRTPSCPAACGPVQLALHPCCCELRNYASHAIREPASRNLLRTLTPRTCE